MTTPTETGRLRRARNCLVALAVAGTCLAGAATAQAQTQTPQGLVGAWAFEERSGDTVLDSSGRGNGGTIQGATRTSVGRFGRGLSFDGQDDWVTIVDSSSLDLTTGMTLEAWVKPAQVDQTWRSVVLKEQPNQLVYALYGSTDWSAPSVNVHNTIRDNGVIGPDPLPAGTWSHVTGTYDGTTARLYVNGAEVAAQDIAGPIKLSDGDVRIGGNAVWGEWFKGEIDEVRIYDRALSADEVAADMNKPIGDGRGAGMTLLEKLKALLKKLVVYWREHRGTLHWDQDQRYFRGT
jgi:hypothetical protein